MALTKKDAYAHLAEHVDLFPGGEDDPAYIDAVAKVKSGELKFDRAEDGSVFISSATPE